MGKSELLIIVRESRAKGTSSPFVGAPDREAEIDKVLVQLEHCLFDPYLVNVLGAYHPQEQCPFINKEGIYAIAELGNEYLLYSPISNCFAKAWNTNKNEYTILGFSSGDVIAEWRG